MKTTSLPDIRVTAREVTPPIAPSALLAHVRDHNGPFNWILFRPKVTPMRARAIETATLSNIADFVNAGSLSINEMKTYMSDNEILCGLLRMNFGTGTFMRTKYIVVWWSGTRVNPIVRGKQNAKQRRLIELLGPKAFMHSATEPQDLALRHILTIAKQKLEIDHGDYNIASFQSALLDHIHQSQSFFTNARVQQIPNKKLNITQKLASIIKEQVPPADARSIDKVMQETAHVTSTVLEAIDISHKHKRHVDRVGRLLPNLLKNTVGPVTIKEKLEQVLSDRHKVRQALLLNTRKRTRTMEKELDAISKLIPPSSEDEEYEEFELGEYWDDIDLDADIHAILSNSPQRLVGDNPASPSTRIRRGVASVRTKTKRNDRQMPTYPSNLQQVEIMRGLNSARLNLQTMKREKLFRSREQWAQDMLSSLPGSHQDGITRHLARNCVQELLFTDKISPSPRILWPNIDSLPSELDRGVLDRPVSKQARLDPIIPSIGVDAGLLSALLSAKAAEDLLSTNDNESKAEISRTFLGSILDICQNRITRPIGNRLASVLDSMTVPFHNILTLGMPFVQAAALERNHISELQTEAVRYFVERGATLVDNLVAGTETTVRAFTTFVVQQGLVAQENSSTFVRALITHLAAIIHKAKSSKFAKIICLCVSYAKMIPIKKYGTTGVTVVGNAIYAMLETIVKWVLIPAGSTVLNTAIPWIQSNFGTFMSFIGNALFDMGSFLLGLLRYSIRLSNDLYPLVLLFLYSICCLAGRGAYNALSWSRDAAVTEGQRALNFYIDTVDPLARNAASAAKDIAIDTAIATARATARGVTATSRFVWRIGKEMCFSLARNGWALLVVAFGLLLQLGQLFSELRGPAARLGKELLVQLWAGFKFILRVGWSGVKIVGPFMLFLIYRFFVLVYPLLEGAGLAGGAVLIALVRFACVSVYMLLDFMGPRLVRFCANVLLPFLLRMVDRRFADSTDGGADFEPEPSGSTKDAAPRRRTHVDYTLMYQEADLFIGNLRTIANWEMRRYQQGEQYEHYMENTDRDGNPMDSREFDDTQHTTRSGRNW